ncbi:hypothetical protein O181_072008 [Austropuccinia psidii MF-1]|uniref:Efficient mitochondria targeting-associated protein 19 n=1 Tax=Austropuccinia psidii MF-1 TaxID=1389203 RepID=A0A9Q3F245_9BASI|nr:hypothetical protein [Austropuccinia psidii MF-1]
MPQNQLVSAPTRDRIYIGFFLIHLFFTISLDQQPLIPKTFRIPIFNYFLNWYVQNFKDPFMAGVLSGDPNYLWFRWLLIHEGLFFIPTFVLGIRGLLKGSRHIYPVLLAYGAAAVTTTSTVVVVLIWGNFKMSQAQFLIVLVSNVIFLIIPFVIMVDMYHRINSLMDFNASQVSNKKLK